MRFYIVCFLLLTSLGCSMNLLTASADATTEEAITFEAQRLMDKRRWSEAIEKLLQLPAANIAKTNIRVLLASAYAGRCGLDFFNLLDQIDDFSSSSLFKVLLAFQKSDPDYLDCQTAEEYMQLIGNETVRTEDQNLLMALSALSKIGAILANEADADNDGQPDAGYTACPMTDALTNEIVVSFTLAAKSILEVSSVGGSVKSSLSAACGAVPSLCENYEASDVDATERDAMRSAIHDSGSIGLNTNAGVPCP